MPERPRGGELDPAECFHCTLGVEHAIWKDDLWHVGYAWRRTSTSACTR